MAQGEREKSEMPPGAFIALRQELFKATTLMSCAQTLDLADLLHTVIRSRKLCLAADEHKTFDDRRDLDPS